MKPTTKKSKQVVAKLRLPHDLVEEAKKLAKARSCSVQEFIRNLLRAEAFNA